MICVNATEQDLSVIEELAIQNYRCFRKMSVPMRPMTVLIGPNNTGKSSFLRCLKTLWDLHNQKKKPTKHNLLISDFFGYSKSEMSLSAKAMGWEIAAHYKPVSGLADSLTLASDTCDVLGHVRYFDIPRLDLSMVSEGANANQPIHDVLDEKGKNLPAVIDYMLRKERNRFDLMLNSLRERIPGLLDLTVETPQNSQRRIDLVVDSGQTIPASQASTGVRLLIFFATLAFHPQPPKLILLEEPETGVHPKRLEDIISYLRSIATGKFGEYSAQIVVSTHSPYLLDFVDLDQDQVLVFERKDGGERIASPVDAERLKQFTDEFMLGELWFNQSEKGLVGEASG